MRVLVVDNDRDTADTLGLLLKVARCDVRVTYDAFTCLDEAVRFSPELLLADIAMPSMDGTELVRRMRQSRALDSTVLAAVTGFSDAEHRRLAVAAGFDEYLVKPVPFEQISELIERVEARIAKFRQSADAAIENADSPETGNRGFRAQKTS